MAFHGYLLPWCVGVVDIVWRAVKLAAVRLLTQRDTMGPHMLMLERCRFS